MSDGSAAHQTGESGSRWRRLFALLGVDVRPGEATIAVSLFFFFFIAITFQYISKAVRQAKFMDSLGAEMLPIVYLILAICAIPAILLYNRAVDRLQRQHVIAGTCGVVATVVVGFALIIESEAAWVPIAFYVFVSIAYVMIVSQFWAYSNNVLNPRQGKRLFGFIGAGGLTGGLTGASIASLVSDRSGAQVTLFVSAAVLYSAIAIIYAVHYLAPTSVELKGRQPKADKLEQAKGGLKTILASRHLSLIAALMFTTVVVANIIDLQFNWAMVEALPDMDRGARLDALAGGYGNFYVIMSIAALAFQLLFTSRIHRKLGIGFAMRVLPVAMALGTTGVFIAAAAGTATLLNVARLIKIGENGLRYSLDQATRELLYFPVPTAARLKARAYIDVFVQRSGKAGAGLLTLPVTFGLMSVVNLGYISLVLIAGWLAVTVALRSQYVESFREGLRRRAVDAAVPIDLRDVTSLEVLVQSLGSSDSRQVIYALELLDYFDKGNLVPPVLLRHESPEVKQKTLELMAKNQRTDAIPLIEEALNDEHPEVRTAALHALVDLHDDTHPAEIAERLDDPDVGIRGTAVASILTSSESNAHEAARRTLETMISGAAPRVRCAATDVIGELRDPAFQESLVQLLYDADIRVQHDAIRAVRERVGRGSKNPLFVPTLISLMRDRRLKHEAREALVSYGETVIPALIHFMNDPGEQLWVRRAIPKTVARVGGAAAAAALLDCLGSGDQFTRHKSVEALVSMRTHELDLEFDESRVAGELEQEARRYFLSLTDLMSLSKPGTFEFQAPFVRWTTERPLLIQRLLVDRMRSNFDTMLGMVALVHPVNDVRVASRGLASGDPTLRSHALEYLDNALQGKVRRATFAVVGGMPLDDKLELAQSRFELAVQPAEDVLRRLVLASVTNDESAHWLGTAAIHAIYALQLEELYPQLEEAARREDDTLVKETAAWAGLRLGLAEGT